MDSKPARPRPPAGTGMLLTAATDFTDIVSAGVEATARGRLDSDLRAGIIFSSAGLVSALAALGDTYPNT